MTVGSSVTASHIYRSDLLTTNPSSGSPLEPKDESTVGGMLSSSCTADPAAARALVQVSGLWPGSPGRPEQDDSVEAKSSPSPRLYLRVRGSTLHRCDNYMGSFTLINLTTCLEVYR